MPKDHDQPIECQSTSWISPAPDRLAACVEFFSYLLFVYVPRYLHVLLRIKLELQFSIVIY
jgi:hypothetical protein